MFKKLAHGIKSKSQKCKLELEILDVSGLPAPIRECRVAWIRKSAVQLTPSKPVRAGVARFRGHYMTQVATMQRNKKGGYDVKEFEIKLQAPSAGDRVATFSKTVLDLSKYVAPVMATQTDMIPMQFKVGNVTTGYMKFNITCTPLGEMTEDGMTEVSGLASEFGQDQDLEGFEEPPSPTGSVRSSATAASNATRVDRTGSTISTQPEKKKKKGAKGLFSKLNQRVESFQSSKQMKREESQSQISSSDRANSGRMSDSGSAATEPATKPPPDFGKKAGSVSSHSARPPEHKPPVPPDFSKKTASTHTSSSSIGNLFGSSPFSKRTRHTPSMESAPEVEGEGESPEQPTQVERPRMQGRKGLAALMQEQDEESEGEGDTAGQNPFLQAQQPHQQKEEEQQRQQKEQAVWTQQQQHQQRQQELEAQQQQQQQQQLQQRQEQQQKQMEAHRRAQQEAREQEEREEMQRRAEAQRAREEREAREREQRERHQRQHESEMRQQREVEAQHALLLKQHQEQQAARQKQREERERQAAETGAKATTPLVWRGHRAEAKIPSPGAPPQTPPTASPTSAPPAPAGADAAAAGAPFADGTHTRQSQPEQELEQPAQEQEQQAEEPSEAAAATKPGLQVNTQGGVSPGGPESPGPELPTPPGSTSTSPMQAAAAVNAAEKRTASTGLQSRASAERSSVVAQSKPLETASSAHTTIVREDSLAASSVSSLPMHGEEEGDVASSGVRTADRKHAQADLTHPESLQTRFSQEAATSIPASASGAGVSRKASANGPHSTSSQLGLGTASSAGAPQSPQTAAPEGPISEEQHRALLASMAELERQAEAEKQAALDARRQLNAARREVSSLKAERSTQEWQLQQLQQQQRQQQQQPELHGDIGELHRRVQEAEMVAAGIKRSNEALSEELHISKEACARLERLALQGLEGMGHEQALEAVKCFEAKHAQLLARYQQMECDFMDEADGLVAQLLDAMQQVDELSSRLPEGGASDLSASRPATQYIQAPHAHTLRLENEALIQQLVSRQMELAEALEEKAMLRRDLYRSKEINLRVANKMTSLQAQLFTLESEKEMQRDLPKVTYY